jgi:hypothetical protein
MPIHFLVEFGIQLLLSTVWAADFKTPAGSSTSYLFSFSWAASAEKHKKTFFKLALQSLQPIGSSLNEYLKSNLDLKKGHF